MIQQIIDQLIIRNRNNGNERISVATVTLDSLAIDPYFTYLVLFHFLDKGGVVELTP